MRGGGRRTENSQGVQWGGRRRERRGELSAAQGSHPGAVSSLKRQEKPYHREAKPLKSLISCGKCSRGLDGCRGQCIQQPRRERAWGNPENGKRLISQSPRGEVGGGWEGGKWRPGSPVDSEGSCLVQLVLPSHAQLWPPCLLLWLVQVWAQRVTQTMQSPTSQPGLSCWVGLIPCP